MYVHDCEHILHALLGVCSNVHVPIFREDVEIVFLFSYKPCNYTFHSGKWFSSSVSVTFYLGLSFSAAVCIPSPQALFLLGVIEC